MSNWEFRVFLQWPGEDDGEGLTLLHRFLTDCSCTKGDLQEFRADDYSVSSVSDGWGAKRRKGKKWEAKYRVEHDPVWRLERFVKKKYGKAERLSEYAAQVVAHLREFNLLSPHNDAATASALAARNATLRLEKARKSFALASAAAMEVCMVNVKGSDPLALTPLAWLSVSLEGHSGQALVAELQGPRMQSLWALLQHCGANDSSDPFPPSSCSSSSSSYSSSSSPPTPRVVIGGYPAFCRALVEGTSPAEAAASRLFLAGLCAQQPSGGGGGGGGEGAGGFAVGEVCPPLDSLQCRLL